MPDLAIVQIASIGSVPADQLRQPAITELSERAKYRRHVPFDHQVVGNLNGIGELALTDFEVDDGADRQLPVQNHTPLIQAYALQKCLQCWCQQLIAKTRCHPDVEL